MKKSTILLTTLLAAVLFSVPLQAEMTLDAGAKDLKKIEVTHSMIGFRNTLRFYVFEKEKAVLQVQIDNKNTQFQVSAKLYVFPENTTADGLDKWINNQHSCGLFPEVPEPKATHQVPAASCKTKSNKAGEEVEGGGPAGKSTRYSVVFEIKDVPAFGDIKIKDFSDTANVHVGIKKG